MPSRHVLRLAVGPRLADHPDLRGLGLLGVLRVAWWSVGLTPTARLRADRFRESITDGRGLSASLYLARSSAA